MTKFDLPEDTLKQISGYIQSKLGLYFYSRTWRDLERGLRSAAKQMNINLEEGLAPKILNGVLSKNELDLIADNLTIGETYFFREEKTYKALEEQIIPAMIRQRRGRNQRIYILSAGCATGEEPYSIAIMLKRLVFDIDKWDIKIIAGDINNHFLSKAREGVYSNWSFRNAPEWLKPNYFDELNNGQYRIKPVIKNMVEFYPFNLSEGSLDTPGRQIIFDVIFCRNVLMYFEAKVRDKVIDMFYDHLDEDGWLVVSTTEISHLHFHRFVSTHFPGTVLYKKKSKSEIKSILPVKEEKPLEIKQEKRTAEQVPESDFYERASECFKLGKFDEAVDLVFRFLEEEDENSGAYSLLARIEANRGNYNNAMDFCNKAILLNKLNPVNYYLYSTILQEIGSFEEAISYLKKAIYLDENFVLPHVTLGNLSSFLNKKSEAIKHFNNASYILKNIPGDEPVPESGGLTAGRLIEIINHSLEKLS